MSDARRTIHPGAAVLAWLWPGLGHISLGQRRRGLLVMSGMLFLFLSGLLIGGIDCIDHREDHLWFLAQAVCGPLTFAVDLLNQNWLKSLPEEQRLLTRGLNRPNEIGTLFIALAGLMNLVVILDALYPPHWPEDEPQRAGERGEEKGAAA